MIHADELNITELKSAETSRQHCCPFCRHDAIATAFVAREMMFGSREEFRYLECSECGSLRIESIPEDLGQHYPADYYSMASERDFGVKRWLKRKRFDAAWTGWGIIGNILVSHWGVPPVVKWLKPTGISKEAAILDVGSGEGELLLQLSDAGFTNLTGVDPFIEESRRLDDSVQLLKQDVTEIEGLFDVVMFNHALEHVPHPQADLEATARLLPSGGFAVIRVPVAGGFVWRTYREHWVQLDAPRHLSIPSHDGMQVLADRCGFDVDHHFFESTAFQFWGSEQYQRDIPLRDERSHLSGAKQSIFDDLTISQWSRRSETLNSENDGDQACYILRKR